MNEQKEQQIKQGNIKDLIKIINKANDTFSYEIFVPSLNRFVLFREINTAQQKKLVKSIIDSPVFNTEFIFAIREIIEENCADSSVVIDDLTIYDKLLIAMNMRINSIGNDLILNLKCTDCEKTHPIKLKLDDLLSSIKDSINIEYEKVIEDDTKTFKVYCELPSIYTEYNMENEFRRNTKIQVENEKELRETIGNVFISELAKYIYKIEIKNEDKIIELDLKTMKFKDRIQLIEKLNVKLLKKIVEYISGIKKEFDKIFLVKIKCDCEKQTNIEQRFSIDSNFFIVS